MVVPRNNLSNLRLTLQGFPRPSAVPAQRDHAFQLSTFNIAAGKMLRGNLYLVRTFMARSLRDTLGAVRAYMLGILDHLSLGWRHTYLACFSLDANHHSSDGQEQRFNSTSIHGRFPINPDIYTRHSTEIRARSSASQTDGHRSVLEFSLWMLATFLRAPQNISIYNTRLRAILRSYPQLLPRV